MSKQARQSAVATSRQPSSRLQIRQQLDATRQQRRRVRRLRATTQRDSPNILHDASHQDRSDSPLQPFDIVGHSWLQGLHLRVDSWRTFTSRLVAGLIICAFCGFCSLGAQPRSQSFRVVQLSNTDVPKYAAANVFMLDRMRNSAADFSWFQCSHCAKHALKRTANARSEHVVFHTPQYIQALLTGDPLRFQSLSLVDLNLSLQERLHGLAHGQLLPNSLLSGPLIRWSESPEGRTIQLDQELASVLEQVMLTSPILQRYKCVFEFEHPRLGAPVLSYHAIEHIISHARERGPSFQHMTPSEMPFQYTTATPAHPVPPAGLTSHFFCGNLQPRDSNLPALHLHVRPDGTHVHDETSSTPPITAELACFTALFPHGHGAFTRVHKQFHLTHYMKYRASCLLSVFTLFKPYALIMFHVRQAHVLASTVRQGVLASALA